MDNLKRIHRTIYIILLVLSLTNRINSAILTTDLTDSESQSKPITQPLYRQARDDRYYLNRYGSSSSSSQIHGSGSSRNLKDERPEARNTNPETSSTSTVEKRCSRCTGYNYPHDSPYPYDRAGDRGGVQDRAYDDRNYDRYYDDRYYDRNYDKNYDRYYDRTYDKYDTRYDNRYDRDRYYDRDRWYDRKYDDRYDRYYSDRYYDRYDQRQGYDRGAYDRGGYDRGVYDRGAAAYDNTGKGYDYYRGTGYDNRGYDNRQFDMRKARPYDEYSKNWDTAGRGGYYSRYPEGGYASGWNYGRGSDYRDNWYSNRARDPYYSDQGYRGGTSYLYDRPGPMTPATTRSPGTTRNNDHHQPTERPSMDTTHSGGSSSSTSG